MKLNIKNYIASFFVGNWFFKLTQSVLVFNILISIFYCFKILHFLIFPPHQFEMEFFIVFMIPPLFFAASINLALVLLIKSLRGEYKKPAAALKFIVAILIGYSYLMYLISLLKYRSIFY